MSDAIEELVQRWCAAERDGDVESLDDLLVDDFVGVGPVGFVLDKAAWLGRFGQGLSYVELNVDELVVRCHGDAAVVVAHQRAHGSSNDVPLPVDLRMSVTVVDALPGERRIASMHYSFIGPPLEPAR
jgi:ketosteroid isomerase-like protein